MCAFEHCNIHKLLSACVEMESLCMICECIELGDVNDFLVSTPQTFGRELVIEGDQKYYGTLM